MRQNEKNEERLLQKTLNLIEGGERQFYTRTEIDGKFAHIKAAAVTDDVASTATGTISSISITSADAGATYTSAEKDLLNELKADMNSLISSYNDLVGKHNTLLSDHNDLLSKFNTLLANMRTAETLTT